MEKKIIFSRITVIIFVLLLSACASSSTGRETTNGQTAPSAQEDNRSKLLGTWTIDAFEDGYMVYVYTFQNDGYAHSVLTSDGVKMSDGFLIYKATNTELTLRDATAERTMEYSITPDGKGLVIKDLWGYGIDVIGVKE